MKKSWILASAALGAAGIALLRGRPRTNFSGKVVLITGGSRGLGFALAREFGERGANLLLCARDAGELDQAKQNLRGIPGRVATATCDVRSPRQVDELLRTAIAEFGRIDVLVNNAGLIRVGPVHTMTIEDFQEAMDVMFWGMVHTTLKALPQFQERRQGSIVNITSIGGKVSVPHLLPYSCAKFAAVAFRRV